MATIFEYAVILDEKRNKDDELMEEAQMIVPVKTILAKDEGQANMLAARSIPEKYVAEGMLDRVVVVVRPF